MSNRKRIAIFGGSFNPPGEHHRSVVSAITSAFDEIIIVPCGPRPDKPTTDDIDPVYRAAMVDMTFGAMPKTRVELFDLEGGTFTRTHELEERFSSEGEIWHIVGADLVRRGEDGLSAIERYWQHGDRLWKESNFAICNRLGHPLSADALPAHHLLFDPPFSGSSASIRNVVFEHGKVGDHVTPEVAGYIQRYRLYRGAHPCHTSRITIGQERCMVFADEQNPEAMRIAAEIRRRHPIPEGQRASLIVVVGGDGTMLRAIRSLWRERLPFYGMNTGHVGMLLNDRDAFLNNGEELIIQHLPLLWVVAVTDTGAVVSDIAFNDTWVERATGQAAWVQVTIDGTVCIERLVGDGVLVATASGSTSYAAAMGVAPLPFGTRLLIVAGSNVFRPFGWKSAAVSFESTITLTNLDSGKRQLNGYIDGVPLASVQQLTARVSKTAAVEIAFQPGTDSATKLAKLQFPGSMRSSSA